MKSKPMEGIDPTKKLSGKNYSFYLTLK